MDSKKNDKVRPQVVKLNKALKIAEEWVSKMSGSNVEETDDKEPEGRPPRLGLGAKVNKHAKVADFSDPVQRKLIQKLGIGSKVHSSGGKEDSSKSKAEAAPCDETDDESESRVNAFAKKRPMIISTAPSKKKKK